MPRRLRSSSTFVGLSIPTTSCASFCSARSRRSWARTTASCRSTISGRRFRKPAAIRPRACRTGTPNRAGGARRVGVRFPAHIERRTDVIEPASTLCPCGCGAMTKIGEDRSERLDIVPARFVVIETVCPRYACKRTSTGGIASSHPDDWTIEQLQQPAQRTANRIGGLVRSLS